MERNDEMLGLQCSATCNRYVDSDRQKIITLKCAFGEDWKRLSAGLSY